VENAALASAGLPRAAWIEVFDTFAREYVPMDPMSNTIGTEALDQAQPRKLVPYLVALSGSGVVDVTAKYTAARWAQCFKQRIKELHWWESALASASPHSLALLESGGLSSAANSTHNQPGATSDTTTASMGMDTGTNVGDGTGTSTSTTTTSPNNKNNKVLCVGEGNNMACCKSIGN
jgi:hypothetical protein